MWLTVLKAGWSVLTNPKVLITLAIAGIVWSAYVWAETRGYDRAVAELQPEINGLRKTLETERANALEAGIRARAEFDQQEAKWKAALKEQEDAYKLVAQDNAKKLEAERKRADAAAADTKRMRVDIRAYASQGGSGQSTEDTLQACRGRAEALGLLLGEAYAFGDRAVLAHAEVTGAAEQASAGLRATLRAWPD